MLVHMGATLLSADILIYLIQPILTLLDVSDLRLSVEVTLQDVSSYLILYFQGFVLIISIGKSNLSSFSQPRRIFA